MTATLYIGDSAERCDQLEPGSVDLLCCSPPFLALRSYLPPGHPDKAREIGQERTPAAFLDVLLGLTNGPWARVLALHGSLAVELGDTYSGMTAAGWPPEKSLCGIPTLYAWSLAYGRNLLRAPLAGWELLAEARRVVDDWRTVGYEITADELIGELGGFLRAHEDRGPVSEFDPWRIRNVVCWVRPNPPVGALGDKFRPATSFVTVATRAGDRWFDLDAVRTPAKYGIEDDQRPSLSKNYDAPGQPERRTRALGQNGRINSNPAGAPPLDWWEITPGGYSGAHYAVWPPELCKRLIESMCPRKVCTTCGQPSRRITEAFTLDSYRASGRPQTVRAVALADEHALTDEHIAAIRAFGTSDAGKALVINNGAGKNSERVQKLATEAKAVLGGYFREFVQTTTAERTSVWSDCGHDTWRPGHVLDPFAGSGTTLAVASGLGRDSVGIDLDVANAALCMERVGPLLLDVVWPDPDWSLLVLPAGSPHPSVYDPWRHQLDDVRAGIVGWLLDCWVAAVAVAMGVPLEAVDEIGSVPARPRARTAPVMAGQGGLFL